MIGVIILLAKQSGLMLAMIKTNMDKINILCPKYTARVHAMALVAKS